MSIINEMKQRLSTQSDRRQQPKQTRKERRAAELADRRKQKRPTQQDRFVELVEQMQAHRDIDYLRRKALNRIPIGHDVHRASIEKTFGPVERRLDRVEETGEIEVAQDGMAVFPVEGEDLCLPLVQNFNGMCDTFELIARRRGIPDKTAGMRKLTKRIELDMPFFQEDTNACRETVAWMRDTIAQLTPEEYDDIAIAINVRDEMARIELEQKKKRRSRQR